MPRPTFAFLVLVASCHTDPSPTTVVIPPPPPGSGSVAPTPVATTTTAVVTSDDACKVDADCTWGEIDIEITKAADCMCLLGCPGLPQNKTTEERRSAQYHRLCKPGMDGRGRGCPIDDCAPPPPIRCVGGSCARGH